jgi:release factor glutamine methyltransferase
MIRDPHETTRWGTAPPTAAAAIRDGTNVLAGAGVASARLDAEVLLRHVLGVDRTALFLRMQDRLTPDESARFAHLIERRRVGEPVAYLTGRREFMGLSFAVGPGALIPRPETELVVEWALDWLRGKPRATIIDVGTGAGAIALSIASIRAEPRDTIAAVDISPAAMAYAKKNREAFGLSGSVLLVRGDLVGWCAGPVDLILANLPYLRPDQRAGNRALANEPEMALVSGNDGLAAIRRLIADVPRVLAAGGAIALEIDPSQTGAVRTAMLTALPGARVEVLRDLAGWDRVVVATR